MATGTQPTTRRGRTSEFRAHPVIVSAIDSLGWDKRQPRSGRGGQLYTQNECLADPAIAATLGRDRPEYVVRIDDGCVWVIEAKTWEVGVRKATEEALAYAQRINAGGQIRAAFY